MEADVTLQRIIAAANVDVEMKDATAVRTVFVVLDTNVMIDHLDVIDRFNDDIKTLKWTDLRIIIVIPTVLLNELDGLKKGNRVSWFASRASSWILDNMKERDTVKVQASRETCHLHVSDAARKNDIQIKDCCMFFQQQAGAHVVLVSGDRNLCIDGEADRIYTIMPPRAGWSSRELAKAIFGPGGVDLTMFRPQDDTPSYRPSKQLKHLRITVAPIGVDDDGMDIDDDNSLMRPDANGHDDYVPSHALDSLHLQAIMHFSFLLKEVAFRVRTEARDVGPLSQSSYAPGFRRKKFEMWTACDCVDYLGSKRELPASTPPLGVFLLRRSEDRGWRRGQDWSRKDWENCTAVLEAIGEKFDDEPVLSSVRYFRVETESVFKSALRPT
ncbi:uncharacterized protein FIBRA_05275 [Fibroporia radiculosa]|uniref:PIN domain-containing protein n=1 Tax=Fibroporia radiculosa TaxID=599839 RepID=J4G8Z0_9APHY|nr:uncharacterized protein FIBRA_05275 [Fibroporia radiculosa]CCM03153.1 predicted protein [Fibroporia radiculosa]